jgi:hypothetical protein
MGFEVFLEGDLWFESFATF